MSIVFTIQHPAHVHFFRNPIKELEKTANVEVVVRDKEIIVDLLEAYDIDHTILANAPDSAYSLPVIQLKYVFNIWRYIRKYDPELIIGVGGLTASHAAKLTGAKSLVFYDTEHATLQNKLAFPFADRICTPESYQDNIGEKQVRYPGFHELAYLHPDHFESNPNSLRQHGINVDNPFSVVRFVGWNAHHDVGQKGLSMEAKQKIVSILNDEGDVYISSEKELPDDFQQHELSLPPHLIHHLLAEANYYIGESGTMATEAAILGTPAIRSSSFVESDNAGVFQELENVYDLLISTSKEEKAIDKLMELVNNNDIQKEWESRRDELLNEKIDTTEFVIDNIENMVYKNGL